MESREKDVMTVLELCEYLQMSEAKVREMLRQGTIPAILIGRQWRIRRWAVERWLAEQEKAVKVVKQHGGKQQVVEAPGNRLGQALTYEPAPVSPSKPPGPSKADPPARSGARKPPHNGVPAPAKRQARRA